LGGSHCCQVVIRVSSWKPGSESLERMMSFGEPKTRSQMIIWTSRGSLAQSLKNESLGVRVGRSLVNDHKGVRVKNHQGR